METLFIKLMAERFGLTEEQLGAFRDQASGVGAAPGAAPSNPLMAMLLASMAERQRHIDADAARETLEKAKHTIQRLREDLAAAGTMLRHLADSFGACPACWGRSDGCRACGGKGTPGTRPPHVAEMLAFSEPALLRAGFCIVPVDTRAQHPRSTAEGDAQ